MLMQPKPEKASRTFKDYDSVDKAIDGKAQHEQLAVGLRSKPHSTMAMLAVGNADSSCSTHAKFRIVESAANAYQARPQPKREHVSTHRHLQRV